MENYDDIKQYLSDSAIRPVLITSTDMSESSVYRTEWVALSSDALYIIKRDPEFRHAKYSFDEISEVHIESFISSGVLVGKFDDTEFVLLSFSNTLSRRFGRLANLLSKLISKQNTTEEDFTLDESDLCCPTCGRPYPDRDLPYCPKCTKKGALLRRVLSYGFSYKWHITFVFITLLATAGINLIRPYLSNMGLFDHILNPLSGHYGKITELMLAIFVLEIVSLLISIGTGRFSATLSAKIIFDIKTELFSAMQKLSLKFYNSKHTGNLMTRVNSDAQDIQYFLGDGLPYFFMNLINLLGILIIMFRHSALLAMLVFIPVPLIVKIIRVAQPNFRRYKWNVWRKRSKINTIINDVLTGIRVVKAFGREDSEITRFEEASRGMYEASVTEGIQAAKTFPLLGYLMTIGGLFVWAIGGYTTANGNMSFGMLQTFAGYVAMVYGPIDFMVRTFDWYTNCMNSAQRIFEIIDRKPDITDCENPVEMPDMNGEISIRNVTFEYEPNKPVLHNITLDIKAGEMIGLIGHSGAGKSTITNLITRLYDVNDGEILIDGVNIKNIKTTDLRSHIGMVLQDTFLFSGTIAENIAYARPDATQEEIVRAAKLANAHDFIMLLPDGYETMLGKRSVNLSGGEKQRLSIARAILVDPKILILDEATASVDTKTEQLIQEALDNLIKGRTTIAIAHRLSTLRNADRLVVVERGRLAEIGTHEELEEKRGIYYDLLKIQKEALKVK